MVPASLNTGMITVSFKSNLPSALLPDSNQRLSHHRGDDLLKSDKEWNQSIEDPDLPDGQKPSPHDRPVKKPPQDPKPIQKGEMADLEPLGFEFLLEFSFTVSAKMPKLPIKAIIEPFQRRDKKDQSPPRRKNLIKIAEGLFILLNMLQDIGTDNRIDRLVKFSGGGHRMSQRKTLFQIGMTTEFILLRFEDNLHSHPWE